MQKIIGLLALIGFAFLTLINKASALKYCQVLQADGKNCQLCQDGYELVKQSQEQLSSDSSQNSSSSSTQSSSSSTMICRAKCSSFLYRQTPASSVDNFECNSLCKVNEIGNDLTRTCEEVYKCPDSFEFGQSFHKGQVDNLLFYKNPNTLGVQDIITSSSSDQKILVWDSQNGQLIAEFKGHTSGVLKIFFIDNSFDSNKNSDIIRMMSFSQGGEIIIWNYMKATIISKVQILSGQLQAQSEIDIDSKRIVSFGFSGEFFLINYETIQSTKYIGHTQVVEQVFFIKSSSMQPSSDYLISTSMDKTILLWAINEPNSPILLINQFQVTKLSISSLPLGSSSSTNYSLFFFAVGIDTSTSKFTTKVAKIPNPTDSIFLTNFISNLQTFLDHNKSIINLIIDVNNLKMITYSSNEILIYDSQFIGGNLVFSLNQPADLTKLLPSPDIQISSCSLFNEKFIISSDFGELIFLSYKANSPVGQQLITQEQNSYVVIQRESTQKTIIKHAFAETEGIFYAYASQVVALEYSSRTTKFIINNFASPIISYTGKALRVFQSVSNSLIATVSLDGRGFVYDKLTFKLLTVLEYSKNKNISRYSEIKKPTCVVIVVNENVCITYEDTAFVCYDPITGVVNYSHYNNVEALFKLSEDYTRNFVFAFGDSQALVYDLTLKQVHSQFYQKNQFYVYNFQGQYDLLYTSSPEGNYVKFTYPLLSIEIEKNYADLNTNGQIINGWRLDDKNNMCITYYDKGLVIMMLPDLTIIKNLVYKSPPTTVISSHFISFVYIFLPLQLTVSPVINLFNFFDNLQFIFGRITNINLLFFSVYF